MMRDVQDGVRRAFATRPRRLLVVGTLVLGIVVAVLVVAAAPPAERTLAVVTAPAQSLMSVLVPLVGILLVADLRGRGRAARVAPTLLAGLVVAAVIGVVGFGAGAVVVAVGSGAPGRWADAGLLALGSVLVQCVALLSGTGLGLLIRHRGLAFLATIVIPLGLWLLLGTTTVLEPLRGWLTPFESARRLLAAAMTPLRWVQFLVMLVVWDGGLNVAGIRRWRTREFSAGQRAAA